MTPATRTDLPRWMNPHRVDSRLWSNAILPFALQLDAAVADGDLALASLLRELEAERVAAERPAPTVEEAMHTVLRTLHRDGAQSLPASLSPVEHLALWTLLRRGTLTVTGGTVALAADVAHWDVERLVAVLGEYPALEDLDLGAGVGAAGDTAKRLLEKGRGT